MNHILSRLTISVKIKKIPEIPGRCLGDQYANQADTLSDRSEPAAPMTMISYARTSVGGEDSHICCITESWKQGDFPQVNKQFWAAIGWGQS